MQNFMTTIIHAVKSWVKNDAFTADDAMDIVTEIGVIEPLRAIDGTIYTSLNGDIYTL
jgi:hypothetical protein